MCYDSDGRKRKVVPDSDPEDEPMPQPGGRRGSQMAYRTVQRRMLTRESVTCMFREANVNPPGEYQESQKEYRRKSEEARRRGEIYQSPEEIEIFRKASMYTLIVYFSDSYSLPHALFRRASGER